MDISEEALENLYAFERHIADKGGYFLLIKKLGDEISLSAEPDDTFDLELKKIKLGAVEFFVDVYRFSKRMDNFTIVWDNGYVFIEKTI